jgi:carboxypeptidase C (cathepsin A)
MRACLIALGLALSMGPAFAEEPARPGTPEPTASKADIPEAKVFTSDHTFKLRGQTIKYKTIAGETYLRDEKDEPTASIFSVAYIRDGVSNPTTRPVTFVFNGGPGSASLWLHMGAFGPKQVVTPSDARGVGAPPYTIQDNQNSLLDVSDLVFIDPVGTGYSRPLETQKAKSSTASTRTRRVLPSSFASG